MVNMWIAPTVDLIRRNTNSDNRNTKKYVRRLLRANVWNYNMLLSNISNVLHNFTFSSVKVFAATAQRSLGWQGREILSMIPPLLFWGIFLQIWMQHSNKVGLHFDPNGIFPDVGWNQAQERAKCHRLKCHVCNYASNHLPLTGLLLFWDNCTLGPKKCTHMAKTIHTRSERNEKLSEG